jgi:hypothetical protein
MIFAAHKSLIRSSLTCDFALQYTLMKDPVTLPSSKVTVDRPVIIRHLLSDSVSTVASFNY